MPSKKSSKAGSAAKPKICKSPDAALAAIAAIYDAQTAHLRRQFEQFSAGKAGGKERVSAYYPCVRIESGQARRLDSRLSYGFVQRPGLYEATLTRPDLFHDYYREQIELLMSNHNAPVTVALSDTPIPLHFALGDDFHLEQALSPQQIEDFARVFDVPDLTTMNDEIANGAYESPPGRPQPLSLFPAPRVDLSLQRLRHYCGTSAKHFQNYVIFTNYQFYIDGFVALCHEMMADKKSDYHEFVEPGDILRARGTPAPKSRTAARLPQMPAYHLKRKDGSGITMVNIGVGPSNAKTITDHIAVLRPHAWLMLGHCAGLRTTQKLGDYVLAHGYLREDGVLDRDVPLSIPIPALAEIQQALETAVARVTKLKGFDLKRIMRTGTVATTADRNWEMGFSVRRRSRLSQSRAIAMDMESGTIATNGFRFRVPYGTLLCVSDKPLHGQLKLPGMANAFYRERVEQHLEIGILAMTLLRERHSGELHSRKLRSFNEVAFR